MQQQPRLNIPNALSSLRLLLVPVLLLIAYQNHGVLFLSVLAISLLTDCFDGYLARHLNQVTKLGAKLDSWGDLLTYGAMVVGLAWIWPTIFKREVWFVSFGVAFYLMPLLVSLLKFHELPSYHTWAAKIAAVLMAPAYFILTIWDFSLPFRLVILFHIWVAVEEMLITFILSRTHYNVPTFIHARELAKRARRRFNERRALHQERRSERRNRRRADRTLRKNRSAQKKPI